MIEGILKLAVDKGMPTHYEYYFQDGKDYVEEKEFIVRKRTFRYPSDGVFQIDEGETIISEKIAKPVYDEQKQLIGYRIPEAGE
jgi:hypothetical protein